MLAVSLIQEEQRLEVSAGRKAKGGEGGKKGYIYFISKMYFSHWEPPGVSERRRSVNLEASISGENQTLGGHSGRPSE